MHYVIDGYNLMHALGLMSRGARPGQLRRARTALLERLTRMPAAAQNHFLVVFDSSPNRADDPKMQEIRGISVVFSHDRPADDWIIRYLASDPQCRDLVIVTDDRRIHTAARRKGCAFLRCVDFLAAGKSAIEPPRNHPATDQEKPQSLSNQDVAEWLAEFTDPDVS